MRNTLRTDWPHWLLLTVSFALAAASWSSAPERIPVHWGLDGRVDRYGGKLEGLLLLPLLSLVLYLVMLWLPRLDPGRANYEAFSSAYATVRLAVLAVLTGAYGVVQLWVHGRAVSLATWVPFLLGAMLVVLGSVLGKLRPNWFVGIRTPWTLSSKQAWTRTHRAGGWLFIVVGVLSMGVAALRSEWGLSAMLVALSASVVGLVAYSYAVWRGDPEKVPPAGTLPAGKE